jgi:hypothetical protein
MLIKETIKSIIKRFQQTELSGIIPRNIKLPINSQKIVSLVGVRRCGKTYLFYDTILKLRNASIPSENILYINFEDERLQLKTNELDFIIQAWRELHQGSDITNHYFFFDEIQNIEGWEKFIRRIYDNETKNIFITGSNSSFLASDIATSLRGRTLTYEVFPFSLYEYLNFKNITPDYYPENNKALILNNFYTYLEKGGFPETIACDPHKQTEILRHYYYVMLYKDLIERYQIKAFHVLKYFIEKLADNLTKPLSVNKIYNDLRSQGLKMDKNLLYEFIGYLNHVYLTFTVQKFDTSYAQRTRSDNKTYFIDNGLLNVITPNLAENMGKLLENLVFLFLRKKFGNLYESNIYYFKENYECDFLVFQSKKLAYCIQVCYDISDKETKKREIRGLLAALKYFNHPTGYIITTEQEEELSVDNRTIIVKPIYKLLIDENF